MDRGDHILLATWHTPSSDTLSVLKTQFIILFLQLLIFIKMCCCSSDFEKVLTVWGPSSSHFTFMPMLYLLHTVLHLHIDIAYTTPLVQLVWKQHNNLKAALVTPRGHAAPHTSVLFTLWSGHLIEKLSSFRTQPEKHIHAKQDFKI